MKSKMTVVLSAVAALAVVLWTAWPVIASPPAIASSLAAAGPLAKSHLALGAPTVVSYQGQVTVGGSPHDGTGYFKFAVVNAAGTTTYWSNNGTSLFGGEPNRAVPLTVTDGLFNVLLGEINLPNNMTMPLTAAVFDGTDRYLRVWFSADDTTYELLSPDRRIAAAPRQDMTSNTRLDGSGTAVGASAPLPGDVSPKFVFHTS